MGGISLPQFIGKSGQHRRPKIPQWDSGQCPAPRLNLVRFSLTKHFWSSSGGKMTASLKVPKVAPFSLKKAIGLRSFERRPSPQDTPGVTPPSMRSHNAQCMQRYGHGSGSSADRVGSRVRLTFYRTFLCIIFHHSYSYRCHLIGENSTDQSVVQDQITSDGYK